MSVVHRTIDASANDETRTDFTSGRDARLPAERRINVVAHVPRSGDTVGDHERPGEIGEDVHEAVHVHVPQSGNQELAATVDDCDAARKLCISSGPCEGDAIPLDQHRVLGMGRTRNDIDHRYVGYRDWSLPGGWSGAARRQERNQDSRAGYLFARVTRQVPV